MPQQNSGDIVTKNQIIARFNEVMRDQINPQIDVGTATPFSSGTYRSLTSVPNGGVPYPAVGTPTVSPAVAGGLSTTVDASELANYLRNLTRDYTGVRKLNWRLRFNKTGYPSGNGQIVQERTTTDYIHLDSPAYKQTITDNSATYDIQEGELIDASNFEDFIANLYSQWNSLKENQVTIFVDTCHASCHGNCHSSRGRR